MIIFAVDDRELPLKSLADAIRRAEPEAAVLTFRSGAEALAAAETSPCDVAFLDIDMPEPDGMELARRLKLRLPKVNIIFATGHPEYKADAFDLRASGYLVKPILPEDVREELDNLRHPVTAPPEEKRVYFRTFGNFEVYVDHVPLHFRYEKSREYLAYLVDRATMCRNEEVMAVLWNREVSPSYLRMLRKDIVDSLRARGCGDILLRDRGRLGINLQKVYSDYYAWQRGIPWAINAYRGEYMSQYSWAELTHGALEASVNKL